MRSPERALCIVQDDEQSHYRCRCVWSKVRLQVQVVLFMVFLAMSSLISSRVIYKPMHISGLCVDLPLIFILLLRPSSWLFRKYVLAAIALDINYISLSSTSIRTGSSRSLG